MPVFDNTLQYSSFLQLTRVKRRTLPRDRVSAHACTVRPSLMQTVLHTDLRFPHYYNRPSLINLEKATTQSKHIKLNAAVWCTCTRVVVRNAEYRNTRFGAPSRWDMKLPRLLAKRPSWLIFTLPSEMSFGAEWRPRANAVRAGRPWYQSTPNLDCATFQSV
jgi:hypothetical protein